MATDPIDGDALPNRLRLKVTLELTYRASVTVWATDADSIAGIRVLALKRYNSVGKDSFKSQFDNYHDIEIGMPEVTVVAVQSSLDQ